MALALCPHVELHCLGRESAEGRGGVGLGVRADGGKERGEGGQTGDERRERETVDETQKKGTKVTFKLVP